jgi:hypothetical protein
MFDILQYNELSYTSEVANLISLSALSWYILPTVGEATNIRVTPKATMAVLSSRPAESDRCLLTDSSRSTGAPFFGEMVGLDD